VKLLCASGETADQHWNNTCIAWRTCRWLESASAAASSRIQSEVKRHRSGVQFLRKRHSTPAGLHLISVTCSATLSHKSNTCVHNSA